MLYAFVTDHASFCMSRIIGSHNRGLYFDNSFLLPPSKPFASHHVWQKSLIFHSLGRITNYLALLSLETNLSLSNISLYGIICRLRHLQARSKQVGNFRWAMWFSWEILKVFRVTLTPCLIQPVKPPFLQNILYNTLNPNHNPEPSKRRLFVAE